MTTEQTTVPIIETKPVEVATDSAVKEIVVDVEQQQMQVVADDENACVLEKQPEETVKVKASSRRFNLTNQFRAKAFYLRDIWKNRQQINILNNHNTEILFLIVLTCMAQVLSILSLTTNYWTCNPNSNTYFGLWNTCYLNVPPKETFFNVSLNYTEHMLHNGIVCAHQSGYEVDYMNSDQLRIDLVTAAQGLLVCGCILYFLSVVSMFLSYSGIKSNNMNSVRNSLATACWVQFMSFVLQMIGFGLYMATERFSTSIVFLFVYFIVSIVVTNLSNVFTIEYKAIKARKANAACLNVKLSDLQQS